MIKTCSEILKNQELSIRTLDLICRVEKKELRNIKIYGKYGYKYELCPLNKRKPNNV